MLSQELRDWLHLILTPEIGSRRGKSLLEKFITPKAILEASLDAIAEVENVGMGVAKKIVEGRKRVDLDRQIKLIEKNNVTVIPIDSEFYPVNLKSIFDPPLVLFVQGEILPQDYFSIAIVGTRLASFYGRTMSEKLSRELVERGFTICSGGARGVDTFSHQAALRAKGRTLAVLGCGLDIAYPPDNKKLFEEIAQKGAMISEFPLSTRPDRGNFPMRNRIISGLSLGVVVIEAPHKSGALITVTHANEQGREVFSVPGHADSFVSKGTNQLLKEGAKLVENADDIIEELEPILKSKIGELKINHFCHSEGGQRPTEESLCQSTISPELTEEESRLYSLITMRSVQLDELVEKTHMNIPELSDTLLKLRMKKLIGELPGKLYIRQRI
ncbi:MAG: DNA-processing protein DprA [Candidatus Omnitrophota bacterium]